jgi:hypothetical protein
MAGARALRPKGATRNANHHYAAARQGLHGAPEPAHPAGGGALSMIANVQVLEELRQSWHGVRELRQKIDTAVIHGVIASPGLIFIADVPHNLPFLHACGVLNDVLEQLAQKRPFRYQGRDLGRLIAACDTVTPPLSWKDLSLIKEAVSRRNDLAHHAAIVPRDDCRKYIDAIEAELVQWGIVDAPP